MAWMCIGIGVFVFLIIVAVFYKRGNEADIKARRIKAQSKTSEHVEMYEVLEKSYYQRFIKPIIDSASKKLAMLTASSKKRKSISKSEAEKLAKTLRQAGIRMDVNEFNIIKLIFMSGTIILTFIISFALIKEPQFRILALLIGLLIAVMLPTVYIRQKTTARRTSIQKQLPEVMDILMVSVEAGLGLDESIMRISDKMSGPIIDEFLLMCREIQMGKPRKSAYQDFGECSDVPELKTFASAIIQAEQLGIPIKNVLKTQSSSMRASRKQRAQERGMKAPVKMIIPMVLFILPVLFIILMAPVVIQLMESFT